MGFDWDNPEDVIGKVKEEIDEVQESDTPEALEMELGDVLFSIVNYCRFRNINAEDALRKTTNKFITRFQYIEQKLAEENQSVRDADLDTMEALWEQAKSTDTQ